MSKYFVKPVEGRTVPTPNGMTLKPEGEMVLPSIWWKRRERDGDVTISADAPKPAKPAKADAK